MHGKKPRHTLIRTVALLSMFTLFTGWVSAQAQTTYTLNVPGTSPWFDTGIDLFAGTQLSIMATGLVTYNAFQIGGPEMADANGGDTSGQNFFSDAVLPDAMIHSLIGKIGGTTAVGTGTPVPEGASGFGPGFVGESYNKQIPAGGRLFLGYNDEAPYFYDNRGSFAVTLIVIPEPSTIGLVGL